MFIFNVVAFTLVQQSSTRMHAPWWVTTVKFMSNWKDGRHRCVEVTSNSKCPDAYYESRSVLHSNSQGSYQRTSLGAVVLVSEDDFFRGSLSLSNSLLSRLSWALISLCSCHYCRHCKALETTTWRSSRKPQVGHLTEQSHRRYILFWRSISIELTPEAIGK